MNTQFNLIIARRRALPEGIYHLPFLGRVKAIGWEHGRVRWLLIDQTTRMVAVKPFTYARKLAA